MVIELLPATSPGDLARFIETRNAVDPRPMTVESYLAERAVAVTLVKLNATLDGAAAGAGSVGWGPTSLESKTAFVEIWVLADHRGHGVGTALFDAFCDVARGSQMTHLHAAVVEGDAPSWRFADQRAFTIQSRGQLGSLALPAPDRPMATPPAGIGTTSLADRPDLARPLYELSMRVRPEIPALMAEPIPTFEAWRASTIDDPGYLPALSPVAVDGDRLLGSMDVYDGADGSVFIGMTAVDPDARRRGIARYLKEELTRRAIAAGFERIDTYNDGSNERIRGLNVELGYVYQPTLLMLKGPIGAVPDAEGR